MTDYDVLAAATIARMFGPENDRISSRDLTHSEVPPRREGKRHNDRIRPRGDLLPKDFTRAVYTSAEAATQQTARLPRESGPRWDGIVKRSNTASGFRAH
jgi:hypothetical protein